MDFPASVDVCDGWLITGSRYGAYQKPSFIPPLEDFIRNAQATDVPMVGICFGHQIIAQALGGKVAIFDGGWAVGYQTYRWGNDNTVLNAWHQDQVVTLLASAKSIAHNAFCKNAAVVYGRQAFTVQPHPEFGDQVIAKLAELKGPGVIPSQLLTALQANLGKPNANQILAVLIAQLFRVRHIS